jgi:hypothetical protein
VLSVFLLIHGRTSAIIHFQLIALYVNCTAELERGAKLARSSLHLNTVLASSREQAESESRSNANVSDCRDYAALCSAKMGQLDPFLLAAISECGCFYSSAPSRSFTQQRAPTGTANKPHSCKMAEVWWNQELFRVSEYAELSFSQTFTR